MDIKELVLAIRTGEIDITQNFFSKLIKAVLLDLSKETRISSGSIPHIIYGVGDELMWIDEKGYNYSQEPLDLSNENYLYSRVPRCAVQPSSIDTIPDQLTNPFVNGRFQLEHEGQLFTLAAEMRRIPVKMGLDLKYYLNTYKEALELTQKIVSYLCYMQNIKFDYLGQAIEASYNIPHSVSTEHQINFDGGSQEDKSRKISFTIDIESNIPVFEPRTCTDIVHITNAVSKLYNIHTNEVNQRNNEAR